ncbi:DUF2239 family protein [Phenylobacterium sp.]|uniref:DUF2239 family protein n=1 Tax=Phenylobacterium sp. TaxID=1871053 RepID=UPI0025F1F8E9|nr:DUF2239 family protein [Phenylobacterium sp.]
MSAPETFTAFVDRHMIASGSVDAVAIAVDARGGDLPILIFDDVTGRSVELDLRYGPDHAVAEFRARTSAPATPEARQGRGRPKLGVVAREVTLLPRHWDWLASQPGGASAALRRLVEDARRTHQVDDHQRQARETAYRVMSALAGDLPAFEEASRALFAGDLEKLRREAASWPPGVRDYVLRLSSAT